MFLTSSHTNQLKQISNRFGNEFTKQKQNLLFACSQLSLQDPKIMIAYHEILLFLKAYPENRKLLDLTEKELKRLAEAIQLLNEPKKEKLVRTGMAYTETRANFSFTLCQWLLKKFPGKVSLYSCEGDAEWGKELLKLTLPKTESEGMSASSMEEWLEEHQSAEGKLPALIRLIETLDCTQRLKEHIWEALRVFVSIQLDETIPSRTFNHGPNTPIYFHKQELKKRCDARAEILKPLPPPKKLTAQQQEVLLTAARASLFLLNRETDTVTYTNTNEITWFELERGIQIALFGLIPERRLPFETYIGYMAFKNGIPAAYGGAWPLQRIARIGLNIYEPFRGGESAYLFAQLMRVYHHYYKIKQFTVEPYQIGYGNKEGLLSGAFWFYHRMGFRSIDEKTALLAESEHQKILSEKGYRTPLPVLKKLTASHMKLEVLPLKSTQEQSPFLAEELSEAVSRHIDEKYEGDRPKAIREAAKTMRTLLLISPASFNRWNPDEQNWFNELSLLFVQLKEIKQENSLFKKQLFQLMKTKAGKQEKDFLTAWQKFIPLQQYIKELVTR